jgi:hypothetical protein
MCGGTWPPFHGEPKPGPTETSAGFSLDGADNLIDAPPAVFAMYEHDSYAHGTSSWAQRRICFIPRMPHPMRHLRCVCIISGGPGFSPAIQRPLRERARIHPCRNQATPKKIHNPLPRGEGGRASGRVRGPCEPGSAVRRYKKPADLKTGGPRYSLWHRYTHYGRR